MGGWAAAWCSWRWLVRRRVVYTLACLRRLSWRVRAWAYLLRVFHGVSWFPCFFVWRFAFGGSLLLDAFTHLVSRRPRPMRAGDVSGRALLLLVVWPLCPFPRALRTSAPFRRVAVWRIVQHTCFGGWHVPVAPTLCCLVVLFYLLVLGRTQVPYSYCMHFAKCFGARNVQLFRLGGSCVRCFSVSVLPFSTSPNSGVKICGGFLMSENTILPFIFAGCASFSWFFNFSLLRSRDGLYTAIPI